MTTTTSPRDDNFTQAELDKFGALANRWWDPDGPQKALHALNPVRLAYVCDRVRLSGAAALDVGCGGGLLSEALAREGAQVTAIDLAPELVKVGRLHKLESGVQVDYQLRSVESLADERPDVPQFVMVPDAAAELLPLGRSVHRARTVTGVVHEALAADGLTGSGQARASVRATSSSAKAVRIRSTSCSASTASAARSASPASA